VADGIKWTIGIPSVPARRQLRQSILNQLDKQIKKYDDIEILLLEDNRKRLLGAKRQAIVDIAQGEYISFVDDDDRISEHYIDTIYPLLDGVDCIGFTGQISIEGGQWQNVYYAKDNNIQNLANSYLRPSQHLTPMRTELVRQIGYRGHRHEDSDFARRIKNARLLQTEHKTEEILYYYYSTTIENREGVWPLDNHGKQILDKPPRN
jgi:hypothetical protein